MIKDGENLITLVSDNFFINYDANAKSLNVRFGKENYNFRGIRTTTIPDGSSTEAVSLELTRECPVFAIK